MKDYFEIEIETRIDCSKVDIFQKIKGLEKLLNRKVLWETWYYGEKLYNEGKLLRVSTVDSDKGKRFFIGYKEKDFGQVCNIRYEVDEEITNGLEKSNILEILNISQCKLDMTNVGNILEENNYSEFMYSSGESVFGIDKDRELNFKLMKCKDIDIKVLLEIEKTTNDIDKAKQYEQEIMDFIKLYKLNDFIIQKEPPDLLYEKLYI